MMDKPRLILCRAATFALVASTTLGGTVCMDCPTPAPCKIEGNCRPGSPWGYYQTRWNRWPGDQDPRTPRPGEGESPLAPVSEPDPTIEDRAAPPRTQLRPEEEEAEDSQSDQDSAAPSEDFDLPDLPAIDEPLRDDSRDAPAETEDAPPGIPNLSPLRSLGPPRSAAPGRPTPPARTNPSSFSPQSRMSTQDYDAVPPAPDSFARVLRGRNQLENSPNDIPPMLNGQNYRAFAGSTKDKAVLPAVFSAQRPVSQHAQTPDYRTRRR